MGGWRCRVEVRGRQKDLVVARQWDRLGVWVLVEWRGVEVCVQRQRGEKLCEEGGKWKVDQWVEGGVARWFLDGQSQSGPVSSAG